MEFYISAGSCEESKVDYQTPAIPEAEADLNNTAVLFKGDYQRLFSYVMSMVRETRTAEDLTQETFLRAYKSRESLRAEGARTAWLYRIATHVCLDQLRQSARRAPMESEVNFDELEIGDTETPSLQQVIEQDEMSGCIQRYLNRLSDSYRAVILLHDMHGLGAPEMAQLLGETVATVKIRLHRARLKLRTALESGCTFAYDESNVLICESKH